jgi:hypothetical protein
MAACEFRSLHLVYMVPRSSSLTSNVNPICSMIGAIRAACFGYGSSRSVIARMLEHSGASHTPSWLVSYFDWAISALACSMSPAEFGVAYGS